MRGGFACAHPQARPRAAAVGDRAALADAAGCGAGPASVHAVRPEPSARARRDGMAAAMHRQLRRTQPHDPVQSEVGRDRFRVGGVVHIPRAASCRHSALRHRHSARRRRPATAHRANP